MNKEEYIKALEELNLPKSEFIILSGGSLVMRGLRDKTADLDLCFSKKLAEEIDLYSAPVDDKGFYTPFENCQVMDEFERIEFDEVDGYQCESLKSILAFKEKARRPKDFKDIERIKEFLKH
ncbi:hypothetical protein IJS18_02165 [Candidatus Saccharibacteria bacterium]|nr:hypothetical protein [Candidatus Saccharibacteria bacterium]